ncbi:hypothetical protein EAF04_004141 [Stromatinia cepivora]|nr:hypothetical protein EAF04_004141 [Stromatinia cepivora]
MVQKDKDIGHLHWARIAQSFEKTHIRTKAIAFGHKDEEVLIGYDDCSIQCIELATEQEKWRFVAKDPASIDYDIARYVSFSPDLAEVAFIFRGRPIFVWTIQQDSILIPPKRCICAEDKFRPEGDASNNPEKILWQLYSNYLLILYEDTKVIDWNVADDEQLQYDYLGERVSIMELSVEGNLLLISDNNGTLSIWVVPEYHLAYRLKCDELVIDLAFSSDTTWFYDIRGSFCHVWEPDALFYADGFDQDEMSSTYPVLSKNENDNVPVTTLGCDHSNRFLCCGEEDGKVTMYDNMDGSKVRKLFWSSL